MRCQGCNGVFGDAAGLIGHIEKNQCKVIKRDDFYKHRAEQQIQRDAEDELNGGLYQGSTALSSIPYADPSEHTSLAEDERVDITQHWQEPVRYDVDPFDGKRGSLTQDMSQLGIDKYPPLLASAAPSSNLSSRRRRYAIEDDGEGDAKMSHTSDVSMSAWPTAANGPQPQPVHSEVTKGGAWAGNKFSIPIRGSRPGASPNLLDTASSVNLLDSVVEDNSSVATRGTRPSDMAGRSEVLPPAARAENQDPNAPFAQVQTAQRIRSSSHHNLESYWNAVLGCYICPGNNCGRRLRSPQEFEQHLLSGVHVGAVVQCPSCLKRFKTITALVAHAESGSTKCDLRKTEEFDLAIRSITAGLIRVDGSWTGAGNPKFESVPVEDWNNDSRW